MADVSDPLALDVTSLAPQTNEPHAGGLAARLNWRRADVLGANDGIGGAALNRVVVVLGGAAAMLVTFGIGQLVGSVGI